jgi:hypothetical protein
MRAKISDVIALGELIRKHIAAAHRAHEIKDLLESEKRGLTLEEVLELQSRDDSARDELQAAIARAEEREGA